MYDNLQKTWLSMISDFLIVKFRSAIKNTSDNTTNTRLCLFESKFSKKFRELNLINVASWEVFLIANRILMIGKSEIIHNHVFHRLLVDEIIS